MDVDEANEQLQWFEHEANKALARNDLEGHIYWARKFHRLQGEGTVLPL